MPQTLLEQWQRDLALESVEFEEELRWRMEAYLDQGYGACHLSDVRIAKVVQDSLLHFDTERYRMSAWVIMPNHVLLLAAPCYGYALSDIMHSIKSYTAQQANRILGRKGRFWFEDYFDRYIRNAKHFENAVDYIESNPVRAGLCSAASEWRFGSAWLRAHSLQA
jgi:putative DNA methylase